MPVNNNIALKAIHGELTVNQAFQKISKTYGLQPQQSEFVRIFVEQYAGDPKKLRKAYLAAGYMSHKRDLVEDLNNKSEEAVAARKSFNVAVTVVRKNRKIVNAIEEYKKIYNIQRQEDIKEDVYRFTKIRATYDIRKLADVVVGHSPEEIAEKLVELDEETAACIDGWEYKYHGKDADKFTVTFKFADRDKSIAMLTKLTGMITDKKEVKHTHTMMPAINISILPENKNAPIKVN